MTELQTESLRLSEDLINKTDESGCDFKLFI